MHGGGDSPCQQDLLIMSFHHKACLEAIELVLEMLEVERSRLGFVRWDSPLGVIAGLRTLPSPLPLVLFPNLLALLQSQIRSNLCHALVVSFGEQSLTHLSPERRTLLPLILQEGDRNGCRSSIFAACE